MSTLLKRCDVTGKMLVFTNLLLVLLMVVAPAQQAFAAELHTYQDANLNQVVQENYADNDVVEKDYSLPDGYTQTGIENPSVEDVGISSDKETQGKWDVYRNDDEKKVLALFTPNANLAEEQRNLLYDTLRLVDKIDGSDSPLNVYEGDTRNIASGGALLESLGDRATLQRWFYLNAPDVDWEWIARLSRSYMYINDYEKYQQNTSDDPAVPTFAVSQMYGNKDFIKPGGGGTSAGGSEPVPIPTPTLEPTPGPESTPTPEPVPEPEPVLESEPEPESTIAPVAGISETSAVKEIPSVETLAQTGDEMLAPFIACVALAIASAGAVIVLRIKSRKEA